MVCDIAAVLEKRAARRDSTPYQKWGKPMERRDTDISPYQGQLHGAGATRTGRY